jgi:hypothetical protein
MKFAVLSSLPLIAALALTARADSVQFSFNGSGVSGAGTLTYTPQAGGAGTITGITGTFSDTNTGINGKPAIVDAVITGLVPINPVNPLPVNVTAPDFSQYVIANGVPGEHPSPSLSYDNTYYPDGSPVVCTDYPFSGGFLDVYGVLFTLSSGQVAGLWSNGVQPTGLDYGVAVADATYTYDYVAGGVNASAAPVAAVPLPAAFWMGLSTLGGLAGISVLRQRAGRRAIA